MTELTKSQTISYLGLARWPTICQTITDWSLPSHLRLEFTKSSHDGAYQKSDYLILGTGTMANHLPNHHRLELTKSS
ncbi:hypothetical protein M8J76_016730 [Diaphorina citri]|nr:hypothetical protein M8J76_016730 [Diaphorina citri]